MGHGLHSQGTGAPACITSAYFINLKFAAFPDDFPNPRHDSRLRSRIIRPLSLQDQLLGPGPFGITMDFRPRCRPFKKNLSKMPKHMMRRYLPIFTKKKPVNYGKSIPWEIMGDFPWYFPTIFPSSDPSREEITGRPGPRRRNWSSARPPPAPHQPGLEPLWSMREYHGWSVRFYSWLVVLITLKHIRRLGWLFKIYIDIHIYIYMYVYVYMYGK